MELRFDAEKHEYWVGDRRLPSVSEILAPLVDYTMVPEARLEFARDRGTAVHLACHLDDISVLDEATIDPVHVRPYLEAYRKFKREHDFEIDESEQPLHCALLGFAGTPDKRGRLDGIKATLDIKTVVEMKPLIGVQLSAYEILGAGVASDPKNRLRIGLQLRRDGTYRKHTYPNERATFLSLLTLKNWRDRNG